MCDIVFILLLTMKCCAYYDWKGCLNQGCLSGPRLPLQTTGKMLLARGCGSEDRERKFTWTLRGTRTRKLFLILTLALSLPPSRMFYHTLSLHIFCPLSTNCILSIFIYVVALIHHSLYNPNSSNTSN